MTLELAVGLEVAIIGGYWALAKILLAQTFKQLDLRFSSQEDARRIAQEHWELRFNRIENLAQRTEGDVIKLREVLPIEYVRREDWIRFGGSIDRKMDTLNQSINQLTEKLHARH